MQAEIKGVTSPDVPDFKNYYPTENDCFSFLLQLTIGVKGKQGGDIFDVEVVTPKWLSKNYSTADSLFGRGKLIVFEYNISSIQKRIADYCESCEGDTWEAIVHQIARIGIWEFEDYRAI